MVTDMKLICKEINSKEEAKRFIMLCEEEFDAKLRLASREAISRGNKIITLSGPTCSGKTTTASLLVEEIESSGHNAVVISIDDFYRDNLRVGISKGRDVDFDSVKTIDLEYFKIFAEDLLAEKTVKIPIFDFKTGVRAGYREYTPKPEDIIIFEGIQAVYPEITSILGEKYTSIFICVTDEVIFNGIYFSPHEIRLLRRLVRDGKFRNTHTEDTLRYWHSVRANEEANIFPNAGNSHFYIDSFLPYELCIIAGFALPQLLEVPEDSPEAETAKSLALRLSKINCSCYDSADIPQDSMYREFIG